MGIHACELQGLFSLLPAPSGTHNYTQIYNAVNTTFLETKSNRGRSNRFLSTALDSFGKYLSNLAIFHDMSNNDVHIMLLRAPKRIIQKVLPVLDKILISKNKYLSLCAYSAKVRLTLISQIRL